jgi:CheY-like chemotaxis protein
MSDHPNPDPFKPVQVLIVEDNRPDVYLLKLAIRAVDEPCDFHVVENGDEAFAFLCREGSYANAVIPDLIVLDRNLPGRDGEDVLRLIRGQKHLREVAVVLWSSAPVDLRRRPDLEADACVTKPGDLESFLALGSEIMGCFWRKKGAGEAHVASTLPEVAVS